MISISKGGSVDLASVALNVNSSALGTKELIAALHFTTAVERTIYVYITNGTRTYLYTEDPIVTSKQDVVLTDILRLTDGYYLNIQTAISEGICTYDFIGIRV